jgi:hypothetical protein
VGVSAPLPGTRGPEVPGLSSKEPLGGHAVILDHIQRTGRCFVRGVRHATVLLCALGWSVGCGNSSGSTGSNPAAPTIADLRTSSDTATRTLTFRMTARDLQGDIVGGTCNITAPGFINASGLIVADPGVPANLTSGVVRCTITVPPGLTGTVFRGTISVSDLHGDTSNILTFDTTLPERRAPAH